MVEREKLDMIVPASRFRHADSVYYARLEAALKDRGFPVLNIESEMKKDATGPFFPANAEVHFNARGHAFTARKLLDFLAAQDALR
jgi:hypothetical protein